MSQKCDIIILSGDAVRQDLNAKGRVKMNLFDQIGTALYGSNYKTNLANDLNINRKTIQRIVNGEQAVNPNLYGELDKLITIRIALLKKLQEDIIMNFTIKKKPSGTGGIHDLASQFHDRVIDFPKDAKYIVVFADHYKIGHYNFVYANDLVDAWLNGINDLEPFKNYSLTVFDRSQNEIDLNKDKDFQYALNDALCQ